MFEWSNATSQFAGPFAWGKGSCLELVFARDAWRDGWLRAEDQDGQEQLADILDRPNAWDPSPSVAESVPYKTAPQKETSRSIARHSLYSILDTSFCVTCVCDLCATRNCSIRSKDLAKMKSEPQSWMSVMFKPSELAVTC